MGLGHSTDSPLAGKGTTGEPVCGGVAFSHRARMASQSRIARSDSRIYQSSRTTSGSTPGARPIPPNRHALTMRVLVIDISGDSRLATVGARKR